MIFPHRISRPGEPEREPAAAACALKTIILLLAPFVPHLAEELWRELGGEGSVFRQPWPEWDPALVEEETVTVPVQVNGKLRGRVPIAAGADDEAHLAAALAEPNVKAHTQGKRLVKTVVVPGRLVNLVVN